MRFPFSRYKIVGHSMLPTLKPGQEVLVFQWAYLFSKPKLGDVVIVKTIDKDLTKRVARVFEDGLQVKGDNLNDSLEIGKVSFDQIVGRVLIKNQAGFFNN